MGNLSTARRVASAAAVGGGGLGALGLGFYGLLRAEALIAKRIIGGPSDVPPPDATGWYGRSRPGPAIRVALLGDSAMAGYGCEEVEETPGAHIGTGIAAYADRRVYVGEFAVVGAESADLMAQVDRALPIEPQLAVISIGGNDVTHAVKPDKAVEHLARVVRRLRNAGVEVVVATCPDLGTIRPINPPLRQVARLKSRALARAQTIAVVEAGGRSVSVGSILGPEFDARPLELFGPDRFHPSVEGYASFASALLPSALAALDLLPEDDRQLHAYRGEGTLSLHKAALEAARTPGTELDGTESAPRRGFGGLLVPLRHRRRQPSVETEKPAPHLEETAGA